MSNVKDAINNAILGNPNEVKNSIFSSLYDKVSDAIDLKKISLATGLFNGGEPEQEEYQTQEVETDGENISTD